MRPSDPFTIDSRSPYQGPARTVRPGGFRGWTGLMVAGAVAGMLLMVLLVLLLVNSLLIGAR